MYDWQDQNKWEQTKSTNSTKAHHLCRFSGPLKLKEVLKEEI